MSKQVYTLLYFLLFLISFEAKTQDTTYYDKAYETTTRANARFMEVKKCTPENPNKCAIGIFSLDSNRIISNRRYSDYENGVLHGRCSRWYPNGGLREEITYENGQKKGTQKNFYPDGQLKKQLQWENDSLISGAFFNADGTAKPQVYLEELLEPDGQKDPSFPGGIQAMWGFLNRNVDYPESAKMEGIQGQVILSFVVGKTGEIGELKVEKTAHKILSNAMIAALKKMPRWEPGNIDGIPVRVRYRVPFSFKLE